MGRYPSIAADKQKTGAARGKLYAMYAKEIYSAAKKSVDVDANPTLKRLIEKAKKEQVPSDVIKRAIKFKMKKNKIYVYAKEEKDNDIK